MTLFYAAMQHVWADFSIIVQTGTGSCVCTIGCRTLLSRTSDNLFVELNVDLTHQLRPRARRVTGTPAHGCAQCRNQEKRGVVPGAGIEPATRGFSIRCSTN